MQRIPDSELEIMMIIWDSESKVNSDYIMKELKNSWVKPTVLKFLDRLCERGFIKCHKEGRYNFYEAIVKKEDYLEAESKSFLEKVHHNSIVSLVASLYDGKGVTREDLQELKAFIEEAE